MAENNTLVAEKRTDFGSRPAGRLRRAGRVPAVVYGLASDTVTVTVPARELAHILHGESGVNTLITLQVDGEDLLTLARQIQRDPVRGDFLHVDFIRIRRDVAVAAEVPVHLVGEATGVRDGGLLEQLVFSLQIEAKPEAIPPGVEVDVSALEIGDQLRIADLALPRDITVQHEPDELVVQVVMPRVVEEEAPPEEGEEVEGAEGEAAEGEAAEGEEAPSGESSGESTED